MNRSRLRRSRRRCAEKMLEMIARGGQICVRQEWQVRAVSVSVIVPRRPGDYSGASAYMVVMYPQESLRGPVHG